jgi:thymidylate synthase
MVNDMDIAWSDVLTRVRRTGRVISPRGKRVKELDHETLQVDMRYPVLVAPERKVNYRFMAAEALWIVSGHDDLASLIPYNPRMAEFSDDGVTLSGAYGPRIDGQLGHVLQTLKNDASTRQATLTTWVPNPVPGRDIPCTVAMDFKIRDELMNLHVFMRSSDIWLGLPYDVFSFACVAMVVLGLYNNHTTSRIGLGTLYLTAASSHLYEDHWSRLVESYTGPMAEVPHELYDGKDLRALRERLLILRETRRGDPLRWWEL